MTKSMSALAALGQRFSRDRPFVGWGFLLHMHITSETVALGEVITRGGGDVAYLASQRNPSPADVVARARAHGGRVLEGMEQLEALGNGADAASRDFLVVEGNGRFFSELHKSGPQNTFCRRIRAISEHTSGGGRIVDEFDPRKIVVPVVAVYKSALKTLLETGLGTAQTVAAALLRGLEQPLAGRAVLVLGYGHVGQGVAHMVRGLGARVTVVDIQKEVALIARLRGYRVADLENALPQADLCVTTTGCESALTSDRLQEARHGLILANVSNKPKEINLDGCCKVGENPPYETVWEHPNGRRFRLLAGGIQVNHVIGEGNPAELMDLSFGLHAMVLRWLVENMPPPGLHPVPQAIREEVASLVMGGPG